MCLTLCIDKKCPLNLSPKSNASTSYKPPTEDLSDKENYDSDAPSTSKVIETNRKSSVKHKTDRSNNSVTINLTSISNPPSTTQSPSTVCLPNKTKSSSSVSTSNQDESSKTCQKLPSQQKRKKPRQKSQKNDKTKNKRSAKHRLPEPSFNRLTTKKPRKTKSEQETLDLENAGDPEYLKIVEDKNLCKLHPTITSRCSLKKGSWQLEGMLNNYAYNMLIQNGSIPYSIISGQKSNLNNLYENPDYVYHEDIDEYIPLSSILLKQPTLQVPKFNEIRTYKDKIMEYLGIRYKGKTDADFWRHREKSCEINNYELNGVDEKIYKYYKVNETQDMVGIATEKLNPEFQPNVVVDKLESIYTGVNFNYMTFLKDSHSFKQSSCKL